MWKVYHRTYEYAGHNERRFVWDNKKRKLIVTISRLSSNDKKLNWVVELKKYEPLPGDHRRVGKTIRKSYHKTLPPAFKKASMLRRKFK
jgi:hypothetical protein